MHTDSCHVKNPKYKKLSKPAQRRVSKKIAILRREGYSATQAAAIAFKYERTHMLGPRGGKLKNPFKEAIPPEIKPYILQLGQPDQMLKDMFFLEDDTMMVYVKTVDADKVTKLFSQSGFIVVDRMDSGDLNKTSILYVSGSKKVKNPCSRKNPIADKDVQGCLMVLTYLVKFPYAADSTPKNFLNACESEGLWSASEGVTKNGKLFLELADRLYDKRSAP